MANQRIAYGLCKKYGIELKEGATPDDAWKALKEAGHGDEVKKETSGGSSEEVSKYVNNSRDKLYSQLTSSYQEDAIDEAEGDTKEEFIKSAVENYRDKIKSLGISTEVGFKKHGDDTHVADIAGKIFDNEHMSKNSEASNPKKLSEKMIDSNDRLTSTYENAKSKGQTPQQVLDTVSYDLDIQPGSEEFKKLKEMIKKDAKLVDGEYKFEQQSASNPKKLSEKMNDEEDLSSHTNPDEEDKQAYKKYWNKQGKTDKEINLDRFDEIIKRSKPVRKQFNVGDELVDTSFGKTKVKVVRKLTPEEKWERSYANNPFAGDYYEVEHDSFGTPVKSIVWAGHLDHSTQQSASNPKKLAEKMK